jgi:hypothetical protein
VKLMHRIGRQDQRVGPLLGHRGEGSLELVRRADLD